MLGNNDGTRVNEATGEETGSKLTAVHTWTQTAWECGAEFKHEHVPANSDSMSVGTGTSKGCEEKL